MRPCAIIYTSNTGHTRQYAQMLGEQLGLPVHSLEERDFPAPEGGVIYLGWLHASRVKGYSRAAKRFAICAVCGVGLCDSGTMIEEVRRASAIAESVVLFTLQGGIDRSHLRGADRLLIGMLKKGLAAQKQRSPQDERMLELLSRDASYVREENLRPVLAWFDAQTD